MKRTSLSIRLFLAAGILLGFGQCKEDPEPDPLEAVSGVYTGNILDNGRMFIGVKATVTTEKLGDKLHIKSVGFTSSSYQLVMTGSCSSLNCGMSGDLRGYSYRTSNIAADGKSLNVSGTYEIRVATTSSPRLSGSFTFTGER